MAGKQWIRSKYGDPAQYKDSQKNRLWKHIESAASRELVDVTNRIKMTPPTFNCFEEYWSQAMGRNCPSCGGPALVKNHHCLSFHGSRVDNDDDKEVNDWIDEARESGLTNVEKTLECFEKAAEMKPEYYLTYEDRAHLFHVLKKYEEAAEDYKHALRCYMAVQQKNDIIKGSQRMVKQLNGKITEEHGIKITNAWRALKKIPVDDFKQIEIKKDELLAIVHAAITELEKKFSSPTKDKKEKNFDDFHQKLLESYLDVDEKNELKKVFDSLPDDESKQKARDDFVGALEGEDEYIDEIDDYVKWAYMTKLEDDLEILMDKKAYPSLSLFSIHKHGFIEGLQLAEQKKPIEGGEGWYDNFKKGDYTGEYGNDFLRNELN